jgi:hypothetical protein
MVSEGLKEAAVTVSATPLEHDLDVMDAIASLTISPTSALSSSAAPVDELPERIRTQVEYYFSDKNLPGDAFMLGLIQKSAEGYGAPPHAKDLSAMHFSRQTTRSFAQCH